MKKVNPDYIDTYVEFFSILAGIKKRVEMEKNQSKTDVNSEQKG